jgi:hypothetical protein
MAGDTITAVPTATMAANFETGGDEASPSVRFEPAVIGRLESPIL